jgi:hypothetical protein
MGIPEPLVRDPWFAFDCMITAYEEKRWWSASVMARCLLGALEIPGSQARTWFPLKRWVMISEIERCSRECLLLEDSNNQQGEGQPEQNPDLPRHD